MKAKHPLLLDLADQFAAVDDAIKHAKACTAKGNRYPRLNSLREEGNRNALIAYQKAIKVQEKIIAALVAQIEGKE